MLKESKGQDPEPHKTRWYTYATEYSAMALKMYKEQGVDVDSFEGYTGDIINK